MKLRLGVAVVGALGALVSTSDVRAEAAAKSTLVVRANDFSGTQGQAIFAVYATKESWLKLDRALRVQTVKITGSSVVVNFPDLPAGVYAVSVIHDANSNGKLDMHWFPIPGPDEGAGVSNDATATLGPPSYDDARFRLGQRNGGIEIKVRY